MLSLTVILFLLTLASSAKGCDDTKWGELKIQYNKCIKTTEQRISSFKSFNQEICGLMEKMIDCSSILSPCMESHMSEAQTMLFAMPIDIDDWSQMMTKCQQQNVLRFKRMARKRKGGVSSSSSRGNSRSQSRSGSFSRTVSRITSRVRDRQGRNRNTSPGSSSVRTSQSGSKSSGLFKSILGRGSKFTSHKPKKSKFNKIGKYAIAGLAAYGTYKLAKKMSKALRYEYDNDDCWEYLDYSESYSCVCHAECNDYVNSAVSMGISYTLILLSSIFSIISHRILY